jgi:hypothetical protein
MSPCFGRDCYRNPAKKGTFLSSYHGDILMEFRQRKQIDALAHGSFPEWRFRDTGFSCVEEIQAALPTW